MIKLTLEPVLKKNSNSLLDWEGVFTVNDIVQKTYHAFDPKDVIQMVKDNNPGTDFLIDYAPTIN